MLPFFLVVLLFAGFQFALSGDSCNGNWEKPDVAKVIVRDSKNSAKCGIYLSQSLTEFEERLRLIYTQDNVHVHVLDSETQNNGNQEVCDSTPADRQLFILKPRKVDRTCLLKPTLGELENINNRLEIVTFNYKFDTNKLLASLLEEVNNRCHLFRDADGSINKRGIRRTEILKKLYVPTEDKCEEYDFKTLTPVTFFHQLLSRSKPVIFRKFASEWPAMKEWTNLEFFSKKLGSKRVHVKLSPSANYEGVEPRSWWQNAGEIPEAVLSQLNYPDLVVVRPATAEFTMRQLVGVIKSIASGKLLNASAYLEYTPMETIDPSLPEGALLPSFIEELKLESSNLWLSDGNTIGKLHQDGADNILVMLTGVKNLTIFDPYHNENFYEAHIVEAEMDADFEIDEDGNSLRPWTFYRKRLLDSTSMVMSPIDLSDVNWERFPNFAKAKPLVCTIEPGDALFMPAWWWHEVESKPDEQLRFNLALNFWFRSFFAKDIPCPECRLDVRDYYYHLLDKYN